MQIIITPKSKRSAQFLKRLLSKLKDVKSIKVVEDKEELPFIILSKSSMEKEWNCKEDNIWDDWAKEKLKIAD